MVLPDTWLTEASSPLNSEDSSAWLMPGQHQQFFGRRTSSWAPSILSTRWFLIVEQDFLQEHEELKEKLKLETDPTWKHENAVSRSRCGELSLQGRGNAAAYCRAGAEQLERQSDTGQGGLRVTAVQISSQKHWPQMPWRIQKGDREEFLAALSGMEYPVTGFWHRWVCWWITSCWKIWWRTKCSALPHNYRPKHFQKRRRHHLGNPVLGACSRKDVTFQGSMERKKSQVVWLSEMNMTVDMTDF